MGPQRKLKKLNGKFIGAKKAWGVVAGETVIVVRPYENGKYTNELLIELYAENSKCYKDSLSKAFK